LNLRKSKRVSAVNDPISTPSKDVKRLSSKFIQVILESEVISEFIDPVNEFRDKERVSRADNDPMLSGIEPVNEFEPYIRRVKAESEKISEVIEPVK
jgi:hypothetical protein